MVLKSRLRAPDWGAYGNTDKEAKCRKHPLPSNHVVNAETDPFFYNEPEARHICLGTYDDRVCPFRDACLLRGLVNNEQAGVWGGLMTEQRRWVRRQRALESETPIHREDWEHPEQWLHLVPPPEYFEQTEDESATQAEKQPA